MNTTGRTAEYWIKRLQLKPHPEGGYFRETYRSSETIARDGLPRRYSGKRAFATAIYFLLKGNQFSAFHRLKSDEVWHFYDGAPLSIFIIKKNGQLVQSRLGLNYRTGERPQLVLKSGVWFAAVPAIQNQKSKIENRKFHALIGCTVAPGFDFSDFEMGVRRKLIRRFPRHRVLIGQLTRK